MMLWVCVAVAVMAPLAEASGVNVSTLAINPGPGKAAKLTLGGADEGFLLRMEPGAGGAFQIVHRDSAVFSVDQAGAVTVNGNLVSTGAFKTLGDVSYMGVSQWSIASIMNLDDGARGWSNQATTMCGGKLLLGGCEKFSAGETYKSFTGLPEHAQVRIKANLYFIDQWGGETAYVKVDDNVVWTQSLDQQATKQGVNICCGSAPESMFGAPVDIVLPHSESFVKVTFGSTVSEGKKAFWGVDGVQVLTRK